MKRLDWSRCVAAVVLSGLLGLVGCDSSAPNGGANTTAAPGESQPGEAKSAASANADDVKAARTRLDALGGVATYAPKDGPVLKDIVIKDGSALTADDLALFGKLSDLEKLQILNCRNLNDEMAAKLSGLKQLKALALTNTVINDATVELIVKSFPVLVDLDLSSNTNLTSGVLKTICELTKLQKLSLVQNRFNDISAQRLESLGELRSLDLRGNMEAGDMSLEVVGKLPKLSAFKHRSTAVTDSGLEYLSANQSIESLLLQDFVITDQSGQHLAKLSKLSQLEVFRCQGFGTEGVLALKGMGLSRLTLRDLPNIDDRAFEVFDDLPKLRRLYLHELTSISDSGLKHLENLKSLELLDIWTIPQLSDATLDVIAGLPNLKELTLRTTGVSDAAIDKLLAMPNLQSLTFKENGSVSPDAAKKLSTKKWTKLDLGGGPDADAGNQ